MTYKDLEKAEEFLKRIEELPDEIIEKEDFKSLSIDDSTEKNLEEQKYFRKRNEIFRTLDEILLESRAFIKVKFGVENEYLKQFSRIGFDSKSEGFIMNTFNIIHNEYWSKGKNELHVLFRQIKAEIKIIIDTNPNELEKYKLKEKNRILTISNLIFVFIVFIIPFLITYYLLKTLVNWNNLELTNPLTWINNEHFGKLEFIIIVFEILIIGGSVFIYRKYSDNFSSYWYEKIRLKK